MKVMLFATTPLEAIDDDDGDKLTIVDVSTKDKMKRAKLLFLRDVVCERDVHKFIRQFMKEPRISMKKTDTTGMPEDLAEAVNKEYDRQEKQYKKDWNEWNDYAETMRSNDSLFSITAEKTEEIWDNSYAIKYSSYESPVFFMDIEEPENITGKMIHY